MWTYNYSSYTLSHHGVLGMKWGIRKKPEQLGNKRPAKEKAKSKRQLKLEDRYVNKKGMSQEDAEKAAAKRAKVEKFIKIAGAITVTVAAAYAAKKGIDYGLEAYTKQRVAGMRDVFDTARNSNIHKVTDLPLIQGDHSMMDDLAAVNPRLSLGYKHRNGLYFHNCGFCSIAYEMRRRGFDVEAVSNREGMNRYLLEKIFVNPERKKTFTRFSALSDITKEAKTWGENGRGYVNIRWSKKSGGGGGHAFFVEMIDGVVKFFDPQGKIVDASDYFKDCSQAAVTRLDNLDVTDLLLDAVAIRKKRG